MLWIKKRIDVYRNRFEHLGVCCVEIMNESQDQPLFAGVIELKAMGLLLNGLVQHELEITFSA